MSSMATLLLRHLVSLTLLSQSFSNSNFNKNEIMNLRFGAQYLVPTSKCMGAKMINQQHTCLHSDEKNFQILGFFSVKWKLMLTSTGYCLGKYYTVCNKCSVNVGFLYIVYHDSLMQSTNSPSVSQFSHSVVSDSLQPHELQYSLSITNSQSLPKLMSTESVKPSNHLILCHPLLYLSSIFPSIRVVSNESALCIRWPKYWSFSFNISPSNEHSGLISFRMDWLDLLAVQGALKSLLQHHSSKASVFWRSAFFIVQLSHPYMTTGKTTALTRQTFVDKVISLLFNMLSRLVITFLSRSKRLLISWL